MLPRKACCLAMLVCSGCATAAGGASAADALLNVAIAAAASGVRRAQGDCYSPCAPGTACNQATGFCEPLPCRGLCGPDQFCEQVGHTEHCVNQKLAPASALQLLQPVRGHPESDLPRAQPEPARP